MDMDVLDKGQKQLFLETLDALQKIPNQTERNALQFEIFGRAGIELGQVIGRSRQELENLSKENFLAFRFIPIYLG